MNFLFIIYGFSKMKDKTVPESAMEVIDEELSKLSFLDNHSSEFK